MTFQRTKQAREAVFAFLCQYNDESGYHPSLREISSACFISPSTVLRHLDALEIEGYIQRDPNRARAIRIIRKLGNAENDSEKT